MNMDLPGRPKGLPNKLTRTVRGTFIEVFEKLQSEEGKLIHKSDLESWAMRNPTEFYKLASKMIPAAVAHEGGIVLNVMTGVPAPQQEPSQDELDEFC